MLTIVSIPFDQVMMVFSNGIVLALPLVAFGQDDVQMLKDSILDNRSDI